MTKALCYTSVLDIPWFMSIAEDADKYLSNKDPKELSFWYREILETNND